MGGSQSAEKNSATTNVNNDKNEDKPLHRRHPQSINFDNHFSIRSVPLQIDTQCSSTTSLICLNQVVPMDIFTEIFSFLDIVELCGLRYINSTCYVTIEKLFEDHVRACDHKRQREENSFTTWEQELFTCSDYERKEFEHLFCTWGDLAVKRTLYERTIPFCCTREEIQQLKDSQYFSTTGTTLQFKVTLLGDEIVGKSLFCQSLSSNAVDFEKYSYRQTVGVSFSTLCYSFKQVDYRLSFWDTAGHDMFRALSPMYVRGADMFVFMIRLDNEESYKWLKDSIDMYDSSAVRLVVATGKDLKKDNRLSYDSLEFCAKYGITYYECSLKDPMQSFGIVYSVLSHLENS